MKYIIDTNVPMKAASISIDGELDEKCSRACLQFIHQFMNADDAILVLDASGEIFHEYYNNLSSAGQDTIATVFLKWVCRHLTLRENSLIERQHLTVTGDREYAEFPQSPSLNGFDISDRKFIALANAHSDHPTIVEGSDSLWWGFKDALEALNIHICFLCEEYVKAKYEEAHHDR